MELIFADHAGRTLARHRIICSSQDLGEIVELVVYPDSRVVATRKVPVQAAHPINTTLLTYNIETHETRRFSIRLSTLTH